MTAPIGRRPYGQDEAASARVEEVSTSKPVWKHPERRCLSVQCARCYPGIAEAGEQRG